MVFDDNIVTGHRSASHYATCEASDVTASAVPVPLI